MLHNVRHVLLGVLWELVLRVTTNVLLNSLFHDSSDNSLGGSFWETSKDSSHDSLDISRFDVPWCLFFWLLVWHVIEDLFDAFDDLFADNSWTPRLPSSWSWSMSENILDDVREVVLWSVLGMPWEVLLNNLCDRGLDRRSSLSWSSSEDLLDLLDDFCDLFWLESLGSIILGFLDMVRLDDLDN